MSGGTCPFAAQWRQAQSSAASTCSLGFGSRSPPPATTSPSSSAASPTAAVACPLGFGGRANNTNKRPTAASFANSGLPRMPLAVLAGHPTLVSVKGVIFDVSDDEAYHEGTGGALAGWAGHDMSRVVAASPGGGGGCVGGLDAGLEGLRYEEHQRLEAYFLEMARSKRAVAVLSDEDHASIFGTPLVVSGDVSYSPAAAALATNTNASTTVQGSEVVSVSALSIALVAELHASVEQGDAGAVARVLSPQQHQQHCGETGKAGGSADGHCAKIEDAKKEDARRRELSLLIDSACPRTGMTPLLKAVEGSSEELVQLLLDAGADVRSKAALYDGDTALDLAKRLGCSDAIREILQTALSQQTF